MRLAILNDLHADSEARNERVASHRVLELLEKTLPYIQKHEPEKVLFLGDLIQNVDVASDVQMYRKVLRLLQPLREKAIFALGNHESRDLGSEMVEVLLKEQEYSAQLFGLLDLGVCNLLWLSTIQEGKREERQDFLPTEQLEWLRRIVPQLNKPTLLCSHHGLYPQDLSGNFYFEHGRVDRMVIQNWQELAKILAQTRQIPLIVQGHAHWLSLSLLNHIPTLTLPAFVENLYWQGEHIVPAHYTIVEFKDKVISLRIYSGEYVTAAFEVGA